ncbi:SMI1 / KNR4 family (SUKH-1) [Bradyrhizobium lablabi]|uniref:SMI1 / KNR4 family (SUKH-1) n=1 Tax=Bradyrhizobium lablabi TaxID=722472 RepID=A0A1M6TUV3_9BRAD|nr:SMI1/KNR4 family protein [Bradyrhizobium lablabi]SHK60696.1 SMI1 / KNR4 family (SUKH-1) [Bradyrhizobium lablabi]
MYLAKFFHRPPGDDDRELLLIPGGDPMVIGIYMGENREPEHNEFLREDFSGIAEAVSFFRRHAADLAAAGYMETAHTKYTLRNLLPDPKPKPDWQKGLDELMLAAVSAPLKEQERHLVALKDTPAAGEPLYLWLAAHHSYAADEDNDRTIRFAESARDTLAARRAADAPHYAWSIWEKDLEGRILEVLSSAYLRADKPEAALEAIEQGWKAAPSQDRGVQRALILCEYFPERQEEAFDAAYQYNRFGGYEEITALPAYAEYLERRQKKKKSDKGWRWKAKMPASKVELRTAEEELGATLPDDYRKFLTTFGPTELLVRLPDKSGELCFYKPTELTTQRDNVFNFITMAEKDPERAIAYFREEYGVSLRDLVPLAEPAHESRCLVMNLEQGERFGWCFHWDHDGSWELDHPTPSFDAALKALTDGIKKRDKAVLSFLGVYID